MCLLLVLLAIPGGVGAGMLVLVLKNGDVQASGRPDRTCAGDWSCSGSKQFSGTRPAPAYHHLVYAGELVHPVQPDNLE